MSELSHESWVQAGRQAYRDGRKFEAGLPQGWRQGWLQEQKSNPRGRGLSRRQMEKLKAYMASARESG